MFNDQCNTPRSDPQSFRLLTFAFLNEFDTDELAETHAALDVFIVEARGILTYDEAYRMFFEGLPGFDSFAAEYAQRSRFERAVAMSNGGTDTLYSYERVATDETEARS